MKIAVMGCGVVGSGVVELIEKNGSLIAERCAVDGIEVKYILDIREFPDRPYADKVIKDIGTIVRDEEIGIVVETMGGLDIPYSYVKQCLLAGKSVVSSNKELVAAKGYELLTLAKEKGVSFLFEASVCGGIPVLRPLADCLAGNRIEEIAGILNGTTNFILTKMIRENMSFAAALRQAQELGYAEKDPTADVEGLDACRKICILASLVFGTHIYPDEVYAEGITKITTEDAEYAGSSGCVIKLLGSAKKLENGKISVTVCPSFVKKTSPLAGVQDVFNALIARGDAVGEVMFYGRGAGKFPTASAVIGDVIDCVRLHNQTKTGYTWNAHRDGCVEDHTKLPVRLYVRGFAKNKKEALVAVRDTCGAVEVLERDGAPENEIAFVTGEAPEWEWKEKISSVRDFVPASVIRVTEY